jgi:hypothetical protein
MPKPPTATLRPLRTIQALVLAIVVLAFPLAAALVFVGGYDRTTTADLLACTYAFGLYAALLAPLLPLPSLRSWSRAARLEQIVLTWFWITYLTHCTWELGWLLLHDAIAGGRDNPLFYAWWAYIDGGDLRYASADPTLIAMELLSVANGLLGLTALYLWFRRAARRRLALLLFTISAAVHVYSTSLYFLGELLAGLPHVNTARPLDVGVKFMLANSPWLIMPGLVWAWVWVWVARQSCGQTSLDLGALARVEQQRP